MRRLAGIAMYGVLVVSAAASGTVLAQAPATIEDVMLVAMNEAPVASTWRKLQVRISDSARAQLVETERSVAAAELSEQLEARLEARLAQELEYSI